MDWSSEALLLTVRPHGETTAIIEVLTPTHGRHLGAVRGGTGRRLRPVLQPGNQIHVAWRARLENHLGHFTVEPLRQRGAALMADPLALAGLQALCATLSRALPERAGDPELYAETLTLADAIGRAADWPARYLAWEAGLLQRMGFGLDLQRCAVSGATEGLAYVSPRTGRAVTAEAARGYEARLIPLPAVFRSPPGAASPAALAEGLRLTGHFLARALAEMQAHRPLPEARLRLADLLARGARGDEGGGL